VAVPAGKQRPYVLDMATSIVPIGRITVYQKNGKSIPAGWGIDGEGRVTENPADVLGGGALMPLGGTELMRGYKGYGLALMVDIFSGVLAGSGFGDLVYGADKYDASRVGHFFAAIRIDAFRDLASFTSDMDNLIEMLRNSPKAAGEERIYIHGEKEYEKEAERQANGIPLHPKVLDTLKKIGDDLNIPFPG
jgi:LDH2 family malate/lactate/ureidoglycolate dehydrogenase